jgi:hypothetical protein
VFIDMTNVESMSEGFADEAFAILVVTRGADWFKRRIQLEGVKPFVRDTILTAVLERRARMEAPLLPRGFGDIGEMAKQ